MTRNLPLRPQVIQHAAQGSDEALSSLVCARQERVLQLSAALRGDTSPAQPTAASAGQPSDETPQRWSSVVRQRLRRAMPSRVREPSLVTPAEAVTMEGLLARWRSIFEMHRAVSQLPRDCREVMVLRDLEGLDVAQVCWLLDLDEAEVSARLLQARALIREQLSVAGVTQDA